MRYSKRRLKFEYALARFVIFVLSILATLGVNFWLQDANVKYSSLLAGVFVFLPAIWAFGTLKVIFVFAQRGYEAIEAAPP